MQINNYTDIHAHLLYGVDDGPQTLEDSMRMLELSKAEGIRTIIATPHYGIENGHAPDAEIIRSRFKEVQTKAAVAYPEMRLFLGSELYCAPDKVLQRLDEGKALPMAGTRYILLEFLEWGDRQETAEHITSTMLDIAKTDWLPILAHAQRYKDFKGKQDLYRTLVAGGVYLQINAYDLADRADDWTRQNTRWLVQHKLVHFIGTDSHRPDHRPPAMRSGVAYLYDHCEESYVDALVHGNAEKLLAGERV